MKSNILILALVGLAPLAAGQEPRPVREEAPKAPGGVARARALFAKMDLDGDGSLSAAEAGRSRIPSQQFVVFDTDRDRKLSGEEFVMFYRELLVAAGREVPKDLDGEAARIEAARRTRRAQEGVKRPVSPPQGDEVGSREAQEASDRKRVEAARDQQLEQRTGEAREDANAAREERAKAARDQAEQDRIATAREAAQESREQRIEAAREGSSGNAARPVGVGARTTGAGQAQPASPKPKSTQGDPRKAQEAGPGKPQASPEERAAAYVSRLVNAGRLTPAQGRDYYLFLTDQAAATPAPKNKVAELRAALGRAKGRISGLVIAGDLSAEEARQLAAALDARARAMLPAESPAPSARRTDKPREVGGGQGIRPIGAGGAKQNSPEKGSERGGAARPKQTGGPTGGKTGAKTGGRGKDSGRTGRGGRDDG